MSRGLQTDCTGWLEDQVCLGDMSAGDITWSLVWVQPPEGHFLIPWKKDDAFAIHQSSEGVVGFAWLSGLWWIFSKLKNKRQNWELIRKKSRKNTIMLIFFYIPHDFDVIDTGLCWMNNTRPHGRAPFTYQGECEFEAEVQLVIKIREKEDLSLP